MGSTDALVTKGFMPHGTPMSPDTFRALTQQAGTTAVVRSHRKDGGNDVNLAFNVADASAGGVVDIQLLATPTFVNVTPHQGGAASRRSHRPNPFPARQAHRMDRNFRGQ
ncbi:hypothetical protein [Yinghuangia soli]|uniref:Uncharacterized protein n=1 Tax=Yinghuangia soli TaxID=2908204 RepID=A0AA41Q4W2_9ACTN|nr:hypothetical protein [Yinghuangia soli]MCF2531005.1 hypothetical protein [Yinghuangia soli]